MAKIYVSIASYRDPLVQSTVDNLFSTASGLHDIHVGVFVQEFESDESSITNTYDGKVNFTVDLPGCVFSVSKCRVLANSWLDHSYDYVLQIDAHSRFESNWDNVFVEEHRETTQRLDSKLLFSSYLPGWTPRPVDTLKDYSPNTVGDITYNTDTAKKSLFDTYELVPHLVGRERNDNLAAKGWYICGHFIFGPAEYFLTVTQPSWVLFWGEELYHSLMAFTNGWDVYFPYSLPVRHMYPQDVEEFMPLNKLWNDFYDDWEINKPIATDLIIDHIIDRTTGFEHFGTKRSIDDLYQYLGYDIGKLFKLWREEYRRDYNRQVH